MSYCRDPIYIWGDGDYMNCNENSGEETLHKKGIAIQYTNKKGNRFIDVANEHVKEHIREYMKRGMVEKAVLLRYIMYEEILRERRGVFFSFWRWLKRRRWIRNKLGAIEEECWYFDDDEWMEMPLYKRVKDGW